MPPAAVGTDAGRAYVYLGGPSRDPGAPLVIEGNAGDALGSSVTIHPDLNGDGYGDLVVGSPSPGRTGGRVDVYFGGPTLDAVADLSISDLDQDDLGRLVATGGDLLGDGFGDLLLGRPSDGALDVLDLARYHLVTPTGGEIWSVGETVRVTWDGAERAALELSLDGGSTFRTLVDDVGGAARNHVDLRVPHLPTRFAELRVRPRSPGVSGAAHTAASFTIDASIALLDLRLEPTAGGARRLRWDTDPGPAEGVRYTVDVRRTGAGWTTVVADTDVGETVLPPGIDRVRLTATNGLGEALVLDERRVAPPAPLTLGPSPWRGGRLRVTFTALGLAGAREPIRIDVHDVAGREVATLVDASLPPGVHGVTWDGSDRVGRPVADGVYLVRLIAPGRVHTTKVLRVR